MSFSGFIINNPLFLSYRPSNISPDFQGISSVVTSRTEITAVVLSSFFQVNLQIISDTNTHVNIFKRMHVHDRA